MRIAKRTISTTEWTLSFCPIAARWVSTVLTLISRDEEICLLLLPLATACSNAPQSVAPSAKLEASSIHAADSCQKTIEYATPSSLFGGFSV